MKNLRERRRGGEAETKKPGEKGVVFVTPFSPGFVTRLCHPPGGRKSLSLRYLQVGLTGFEPATSWSRSIRPNRRPIGEEGRGLQTPYGESDGMASRGEAGRAGAKRDGTRGVKRYTGGTRRYGPAASFGPAAGQ